jgi:hypothetical protein
MRPPLCYPYGGVPRRSATMQWFGGRTKSLVGCTAEISLSEPTFARVLYTARDGVFVAPAAASWAFSPLSEAVRPGALA